MSLSRFVDMLLGLTKLCVGMGTRFGKTSCPSTVMFSRTLGLGGSRNYRAHPDLALCNTGTKLLLGSLEEPSKDLLSRSSQESEF